MTPKARPSAKEPAARRGRRVPRTIRDVQSADPTVLAMMSRAEVDAMSAAARAARAERLRTDTTTEWGRPEIAAYCHVDVKTVSTWRWRQNTGQVVNGRRTVLPPPIPGKLRRGGVGQPGPLWLMSTIVTGWAPEMQRCDRHDYVAFPEGRKRPGRPPEQRAGSERIGVPSDPEQRLRVLSA